MGTSLGNSQTSPHTVPNKLFQPFPGVSQGFHSCPVVRYLPKSRVAHNPKVAGSNPAPATNIKVMIQEDFLKEVFSAWTVLHPNPNPTGNRAHTCPRPASSLRLSQRFSRQDFPRHHAASFALIQHRRPAILFSSRQVRVANQLLLDIERRLIFAEQRSEGVAKSMPADDP